MPINLELRSAGTPTSVAAAITLLLTAVLLAQTGSPVNGIVTTKDGQSVAGVSVYGSRSERNEREKTTTDKTGQFRLQHPGAVVHFFKKDFQPHAVVIAPQTEPIRVMLEPSTRALLFPDCGKLSKGSKRVGGLGKYGLHFDVPKRDAVLVKGKPDVDYVVHIIKPKNGLGHLELWFGGLAMDIDPTDEDFLNSASFAQRHIVSAEGELVGRDSWGHLRSGGLWRRTAVAGQGGALYTNATPENAMLFDAVLNSLCWIPYP